MEPLYFACSDCKEAVSAGQRWAYGHLVMPGIAPLGGDADPYAVLRAPEYWSAPEGDDWSWLRELLPKVRAFLERHKHHRLRSGFFRGLGITLLQGERFRTTQALQVGCLTHWHAPYTGGGNEVPLPANEVFVVAHDQVPGAIAVGCDPQRYEELHDYFVATVDRENPRYAGYSLVIEVQALLQSCERVD
jgi:hypothetical protein